MVRTAAQAASQMDEMRARQRPPPAPSVQAQLFALMGADEPLQAIRQSPEGMPLRAGESIRVRPKHWQVFDAQGRTVQHGRHPAMAA